ncbi:MAG: sulfatase-like hydrolase/transferase [Rikenellaceae bacterium]
MNNNYIKGAVSLTIAMLGISCQGERDGKPNFLFIIADDHCYNALESLNMDGLKTPNLDKLRASGTYFSHAFNQGSWVPAISMASRSMLVTGQNVWNVREYSENSRTVVSQTPAKDGEKVVKTYKLNENSYWPQYMKSAGYDTYFAGKWHNTGIVEQLFDHYRNVRGGMAQQHKDCYRRNFIEGRADKWQPYDTSFGGYWEGGTHWSKVLKDDALYYFDQIEKSDKPFFMYLGFNAPHDPRQSPKEYVDMYPTSEVSVPTNFVPKYEYADQIGCSQKLRDERLAPFPRTEYSVKVNRQEYFASITYMDKQIGDIVAKLKASGEFDNTYIIYTADHGLAVGDHGMLGKQNMYDASLRVPFFISGPDIPQGKQIDDLIYLQDAMATIMDLAGSKYMDNVAFKSVMPLIRGESGRDAVYGGYTTFQRMVRNDKYKMIIYPEAEVIRLYDIQKDPLEMNDIANEKGNREILSQLYARFKELQIEMGDTSNYDNLFNEFNLQM